MIEIKIDTRDVEIFLDKASERALGKAVNRSINEAAVYGKKLAKEQILDRSNIKSRTVQKRIIIQKARGRRWQGGLLVSSYGSPLIDFKPRKKVVRSSRGRRKGVTVEVIKGRRRVVKGGFIANTSRRRGVFVRRSRARGDLEHTLTSSVYDFFKGTSFYRRASRVMQYRFDQRFRKNFDYYLTRI